MTLGLVEQLFVDTRPVSLGHHRILIAPENSTTQRIVDARNHHRSQRVTSQEDPSKHCYIATPVEHEM
jgi:hypothetical protein